jgi:hypothetical protein
MTVAVSFANADSVSRIAAANAVRDPIRAVGLRSIASVSMFSSIGKRTT